MEFLIKHGVEWFGILATISLAIYIKILEKRMNKDQVARERRIYKQLEDCHKEHLESKERHVEFALHVSQQVAEQGLVRDQILVEKLEEIKKVIAQKL